MKNVVCVLALVAMGCGTDVDLGGSVDSGNAAPVDASCPDFAAPDASASCRACSKSSSDCQPNGCYGGYWCDTKTVDCLALPPSKCIQ